MFVNYASGFCAMSTRAIQGAGLSFFSQGWVPRPLAPARLLLCVRQRTDSAP